MSGIHSSESSSSSSSHPCEMRIDIRPMIEDVSQVMTKHITNILTGVIGEYTIYKETHDTIMGLPCVRKLQERIMDLEQTLGGDAAESSSSGSSAATALATAQNSREDEIAQLQTAIIDLNRYIHALESKVENNTRGAAAAPTTENVEVAVNGADDEESVKLKIQENDSDSGDSGDGDSGDGDSGDDNAMGASIHKNVIITADAIAEVYTEVDDEEAEEAEEEVEDTEADAEAEEAEEVEETETEADAEEVEEAEETEVEEAEVDEEETEEAEETEADAEETEVEVEVEEEEADAEVEEAKEADDAEIEVSEVKIKGKTYFTTDAQNGIIYACVDDDVGDEVGVFKNGIAVFNKTKK